MSDFRPLEGGIRIDVVHSLDQQTGAFQSIRDGLPELIKNSKDQYARLGITEKTEREIVVIVARNNRDLAVLDFGGAGDDEFEGWAMWASRTAGRGERADDIEAGHGNGGKAFMVRGGLAFSSMYSSRAGRRTQMGFLNDRPDLRYHAGYFADESGRAVHNLPDSDAIETLNGLLQPLGLGVNRLPPAARDVLQRRRAFTLVVLTKVRDLVNTRSPLERIRAIPSDLNSHPQAALTIESGTVWVMHGRDRLETRPLEVPNLEPRQGFEEPFTFEIPEHLEDPQTGDIVEIPSRPVDEQCLEIRATERQLRLGSARPLNVIRVRNARNVVASWSIADLAPRAGSASLYGRLQVPVITEEHVAGAERQSLADIPVVRALRHWTAGKVNEIATEIEQAQVRQESSPALDKTSTALQQFRDLMRQFLTADSPGGPTPGDGQDGPRPIVERRFGSRVDEIVLEGKRTAMTLAAGVRIPLAYTCYERTNEQDRLPVLRAAIEVTSDPPGMFEMVRPGVITASRAGCGTVYVRTVADGVVSNKLRITAVDVADVELGPPQSEVKQGQRVRIDVSTSSLVIKSRWSDIAGHWDLSARSELAKMRPRQKPRATLSRGC